LKNVFQQSAINWSQLIGARQFVASNW